MSGRNNLCLCGRLAVFDCSQCNIQVRNVVMYTLHDSDNWTLNFTNLIMSVTAVLGRRYCNHSL